MAIRRTFMGIETEYAIAPRVSVRVSDAGRVVEDGSVIETRTRARADALVEGVCKRLANLPAARAGRFLLNASKIYRDRGQTEYASAEAADPIEACAQILAGDQLLDQVIRDPSFGGGARSMRGLGLFNINLDYGEPASSWWASHENFSTTGPLDRTRAALAPHLCSRVIYTGAGGFDPLSPLRFVLSPRAMMLTRGGMLAHEPFFHDRTNSYAGPDGVHPRTHLICGESLRSHRSLYLRLATTALITNLADQDIVLDRAYQPQSPGAAFRTFAGDLSFTATVRCNGGAMRSAMEIQHALLDMVIKAHAAGKLPEWAGQVIPMWQGTLMNLSTRGRNGVERNLDWAIKLTVFEAHAGLRGMSFAQLSAWNDVLTFLSAKSPDFAKAIADPPTAMQSLSAPLRRAAAEHLAQRNSPLIAAWWDQLPLVLQLRLELRELDWRYHEIGGGIFEKLAGQNLLHHGVPGLTKERIDHAMTHPPADTRAAKRAEIVSKWHGTPRGDAAQCDWDQILDPTGKRVLYLNESEEVRVARWRPFSMTPDGLLRQLNVAISHYQHSHFTSSARELAPLRLRQMCDRSDPTRERTTLFRTHRYSAWVSARLGLPSCMDHLRRIHRDGIDARTYFKVADHLYCLRFLGIRPHADMDRWIPLAERLLERPPHCDEPIHASLLEHMGAWHIFRGELDRAEAYLKRISAEHCLWRRVRIRCLLADLERRRGQMDRAHEWLNASLEGTSAADRVLVAEQITPTRAKLLEHANQRSAILDTAAASLRTVRHRMALARVLLLRARGVRGGSTAERLEAELKCLRGRTLGLRPCELMARIMSRWDEWIGDERTADEFGDRFWSV